LTHAEILELRALGLGDCRRRIATLEAAPDPFGLVEALGHRLLIQAALDRQRDTMKTQLDLILATARSARHHAIDFGLAYRHLRTEPPPDHCVPGQRRAEPGAHRLYVGAHPLQVLGELLRRLVRSEEHTSELQSVKISYAVFCL